jgi:ketosteroid isomerase-like protein
MDRFARMMDAGVRTTFEIHDVVANDEHAVALVHVKVENASGMSYEGPQVQVLHVRDGKALEYWGMNQDQAAIDLILDS